MLHHAPVYEARTKCIAADKSWHAQGVVPAPVEHAEVYHQGNVGREVDAPRPRRVTRVVRQRRERYDTHAGARELTGRPQRVDSEEAEQQRRHHGGVEAPAVRMALGLQLSAGVAGQRVMPVRIVQINGTHGHVKGSVCDCAGVFCGTSPSYFVSDVGVDIVSQQP